MTKSHIALFHLQHLQIPKKKVSLTPEKSHIALFHLQHLQIPKKKVS